MDAASDFRGQFPAVCTALAEKFGKAFLIATAE
jgi:hypothetical protein